MIAVNSAATVTCPLAFLGYCRNSNLRLLFPVRVLFKSVAGADVLRYWFTYEFKPDGLAKRLGSNSFTIHCERVEAAKEGVS